MSMMSCKGYDARIAFDAGDEIFFGGLTATHDIISFYADAVADLEAAFHEAVDDDIETCAKVGTQPEKPYSGS